jgi:hypothetical protein
MFDNWDGQNLTLIKKMDELSSTLMKNKKKQQQIKCQ